MERYKNPIYTFKVSSDPHDLEMIHQGSATLVISLETLEHIPPEKLEMYLKRIYDIMAQKAYFFITIPNEKGIIFLIKYITKKIVYKTVDVYSLKEIYAAVLGKMHLVKRKDHKGFDWELFVDQLRRYFTVLEIEGVQVPGIPPSLNLTIGVVCCKEAQH